MTNEIRESLQNSIKAFMEEKKINWYNIQKTSIKTSFGCPVEWKVLYKIMKDKNYNSMQVKKQSALLSFFGTKHEKLFGVIKLTENEKV